MSEEQAQKRGRKPKRQLKRSDVRGAKFLKQIMDLLSSLHDHGDDPKRNLHYDEFCAWLLLYFFSPVLDSMRGLQKASEFESIQRKLKLPRFSLGSFSEAGTVFDPDLLVPIMETIFDKLDDIETDSRLRMLGKRPIAVDGTILRALPKMVWALWRDDEHRAARMHLQFDLLKGAPVNATLTHANVSEIAQLKANLQSGAIYIEDRGYFCYPLMAEILKVESSFVTRVKDSISYEVLHENPIAEADAKKGVEADLIVRAGSKPNEGVVDSPLRLVKIRVRNSSALRRQIKRIDSKTKMYRTDEEEYVLVLLTDLVDLDVSLIALLYLYRWTIELFFRWLKSILKIGHLVANSQNGVTIMVYCALIASMLIVLWTGCKPTKRTYEAFCFFFSGWITEAELIEHIQNLPPAKPTH